MKKVSMKTKRMTMDAMLSAMCAVLGYVSIDMNVMKISLESFPVLLGAFLFGPADGALIGFAGTLVYQLLRYGVSTTTLLWILPYVILGFLCGSYAKGEGFVLERKGLLFAVILGELSVTALNSVVLYLDSRIYGYYYPEIIAGMLIPRIGASIAKSIIFGLALPVVIKSVRKSVK